MSKIIFKKHLSPVRPKLVPKFKMLRIYRNLANLIDLDSDVKDCFY